MAGSEIDIIDRVLQQASEPEGSRPNRSPASPSELVTALGGREGLRTFQIRDELVRLREVRQAQSELAAARIAALEAKTADLKARLADIGQKQVQLRELRREATAMQAQYESLLARFEASQGEGRFFRSSARVIERAIAPAEPANPGVPLVVGAASVAGLIVGLGLVFLREQVDDTLRCSDDVVEKQGVAYLGAIPLLGRRDLQHLPPELGPRVQYLKSDARRQIARLTCAATAPFSLLAETFRRTQFELMSRRSGRQVVAIVSVRERGGQELLRVQPRLFLGPSGTQGAARRRGRAQSPTQPQLRAPRRGRRAGMARGRHGNRGVETPNLSLIFPHDLRLSHSTERHLEALPSVLQGAQVDYVILDTAPLAYVSDSLSLSAAVDSAVLVVEWGKTSSGALHRVLKMNAALSEKIVGACLSKARIAAMRRYELIPLNESYYRSAPEPSEVEASSEAISPHPLRPGRTGRSAAATSASVKRK